MSSNPPAQTSHAAPGRFLDRGERSYDPRWTAVDTYVLEHLHPASRPNSKALLNALEHSAKNGLPDISVCPTMGKFLAIQCRAVQATHALEFGTLGGYSTIWMASENPQLHITTLEVSEHHATVARANFAAAGLSDRIDVRVGPALDTIATLEAEVASGKRPTFDFVFIDADKVSNWAYFDAGVRMGRKGTLILVDNVVRDGRLARPELVETDAGVRGARNVVEKVGKDERVMATVMQVVAEKSYDGVLVATKI